MNADLGSRTDLGPAAGYRHPVGLVEAVQVLVRGLPRAGHAEARGI